MAATQETTQAAAGAAAASESNPQKIDPTAPAGSENSLGAESVRDGRPATCDDVVEAIDEVGPDQ